MWWFFCGCCFDGGWCLFIDFLLVCLGLVYGGVGWVLCFFVDRGWWVVWGRLCWVCRMLVLLVSCWFWWVRWWWMEWNCWIVLLLGYMLLLGWWNVFVLEIVWLLWLVLGWRSCWLLCIVIVVLVVGVLGLVLWWFRWIVDRLWVWRLGLWLVVLGVVWFGWRVF